MALDELTPPTSAPQHRQRWWKRPWVLPLAMLTAIFLIYALPPYLGLDPSQARLPLPDSPIFYPALVTHIFFGSVLLACAVLQLWPWLRRHHLKVHRWSGRIYALAAIPVGVGGLIVSQFPHGGPVQQVANSTFAVLFLGCTLLGYIAVRQGRIADHREWMIRSYALAFSIVVNRLWLVILMIIFAPDGVMDDGMIAAIGLSSWLSWVGNLLVAEWWLHRKPLRSIEDLRAAGAL
jgi:uncharacterized membrane protein YozB (DUF420 family)